MPTKFSELKSEKMDDIVVQSYNRALAGTAFANTRLNTLQEVENAMNQQLSVTIASWTDECNTLVAELNKKFRFISLPVGDKENSPKYRFALAKL